MVIDYIKMKEVLYKYESSLYLHLIYTMLMFKYITDKEFILKVIFNVFISKYTIQLNKTWFKLARDDLKQFALKFELPNINISDKVSYTWELKSPCYT